MIFPSKTAFINEIAVKYTEEKQKSKGHVKKGRFNQIVEEIFLLRNIDRDVTISKTMIERMIQMCNLILSSAVGGKPSPLTACEGHFVDIIFKLSCCKHNINLGEGLHLINSLI